MQFPLIEISGPPSIRGIQYGKLAKDRIYKGIEHYSQQLQRLNLDQANLEKIVKIYLPVMENFDSSHVEELKGIAKGSGVSFEEIVLLNARTEILKLASSKELRDKVTADMDGCTGVIIFPEMSDTGNIIHAQNWDWKVECAETAVVLRIRRDDGPDILTFTEAGALARSGINARHISLTANFLESSIDYQKLGVPLPQIRRKILEQEHFALALHAAYTSEKSGSSNMMLSFGGGLGFNFECAPNESFQVEPTGGILVHANHWISPVALTKFKDRGINSTPDSLYRDVRVRQVLTQDGNKINIDRVKLALLDDLCTPWSVCRPPRLNMTSNLSATVATLIMDPAKSTLDIACLPAINSEFTRYDFKD